MGCDLADTYIHFHSSDFTIRPLSVELDKSRRDDNTLDHATVRMSAEAGQHIKDNAEYKEVVTITAPGTPLDKAEKDANTFHRGWYKTDSVQKGDNVATFTLQDPVGILEGGVIDKEWSKITLKNVVKYIFENRHDPYNVLSGLEFTTPDPEDVMHQFKDLDPEENATPEWLPTGGFHGIANWHRELNPMADGDGRFDFREESPLSALKEVCSLWETSYWVKKDGTLVIGKPDLSSNVKSASSGKGSWNMTDWSLPDNPTPLKGVYVKGQMDQKGGKDNIAEEAWNFVTDKKKFQTRAYAGFEDTKATETKVLEKKNTANPETLKEVAKRGLLKAYLRANRGSIEFDALSSINDAGVEVESITTTKPGDHMVIEDNHGCDPLDPGIYEVHNVNHTIDGDTGWAVDLRVTQKSTHNISVKFWYFDPTDADMAEDGGAP